jgi:PhnB protein
MTTDQRRRDEAVIRDLIAKWASAVENKDAEKIVEAYAPDAILYDVAFPVHGKDAIKALWERCFPYFPGAFRSEHEDLSVTVEGDIAIAHGFHRFIPDEPHHPCGQFISRVTAVFRRIGGEWRVIHEHVSIPFQMEGAEACASGQAKQKSAAELAAENCVHRLSPHLVCANAAEAIDFYKKAFGATELMRLPGPDGKLMHACVSINGSSVMLVDEYAGMGIKSPATLDGTPVTMHLIVDDADAFAERAVAAGATLAMPVADMFWGDRYGVLRDPFGHRWSVATPKRPVFGKELEEAAAAAIAAHKAHGGAEACA